MKKLKHEGRIYVKGRTNAARWFPVKNNLN
jgi:hypothetical protein